MEELRVLDENHLQTNLRQRVLGARAQYLAMYSTWLGGVVFDPMLMAVPVDDHLVHRGDGVFEAIKCVGLRVYALDRHLERLASSAEAIGLTLPFAVSKIKDICLQTTEMALLQSPQRLGVRDVMLRLYISRGPGGFTTNPYECVGSQMYLVITPFLPVGENKYLDGVHVGVSQIKVKEGVFSTVKSCNYLPNVLMKKEAVDRKLDFTVSVDAEGGLAESSTENFAIITKDGAFVIPSFNQTLRGITAVRVMELARGAGVFDSGAPITNGQIRIGDVRSAREAMMLGTTLDVLPVTRFENEAIGDGRVGPVCQKLLRLMREDLRDGPLAHPLTSVPVL